MLRGVVFDMDGVLIDSHKAHLHAWRMFLSEVGRKASDEDMQFVLDGRKRQEILTHFLGDLSEQELADYSRRKERHFMDVADRVCLMPGVVRILDALRHSGILMAVATSASSVRAHSMLGRFGLTSCFEAIVTGNDVTRGKPDPAIFAVAAAHLAPVPADLIAIDDAVSGIKAARRAGLRCIGMGASDRADQLRDAGAELVLKDFDGLHVSDLQRLCIPDQSSATIEFPVPDR